jgi:5-methylcytosine-specific restriction enzyme B
MREAVHNRVEARTAHSSRRRPQHSLAEVCEVICNETKDSGLDFGSEHETMIRTFMAALATKPFVILSGLSGAGKTRLATSIGQWFGRDHLLVQPVRPDWTSPVKLLGQPNYNSESMGAQFAWDVPRTLEFALRAARNPSEPYLLVLEEMNLAHVEQYLADVLSGIESNQAILPNLFNDGSGWRMTHKDLEYVPWPKNLFLVGTINIDETTYKFSPKVLDRSSMIEFRVLPGDLKIEYSESRPVDKGIAVHRETFLEHAINEEPSWDHRHRLALGLQHLHRLLYEHDHEFGHRVYRESLRFGSLMGAAGCKDVRDALDAIVVTKVLPKFENSGEYDRRLIHALSGFALFGSGKSASVDPLADHDTSPVLASTFWKLRRLARRLEP